MELKPARDGGAPGARALDVAALGARVLAREPTAVAAAISLVEDRRPTALSQATELLGLLARDGRGAAARRVGVTGPPGVGKSSLLAGLSMKYRATGRAVAVLAVDPSSPRSGGALLGDRARMTLRPDDRDLYMRSMASGGELGGLARAAGAAVDVLSAAYDVVFVETTGVGQSETDVEHVADTVVLVIQPGSGDVLQFLKAGILEIPDLFVINKADLRELAERAEGELLAALGANQASRPGSAPSLVLSTSTVTGRGLTELVAALDAADAALRAAGGLERRRLVAAARWTLRLYAQRFGEVGVEAAGGRDALLAALTSRLAAGATSLELVVTSLSLAPPPQRARVTRDETP